MNFKYRPSTATIAYAALAVALVALLSGCGKTAEDKIRQQVQDSQHSLTAEERGLAEINAKQYFEKEFPVSRDGKLMRERGAFLECRPMDSNFNGLVTCRGKVPTDAGGYQDITRYCGYRKELVGCSDVDNVKS